MEALVEPGLLAVLGHDDVVEVHGVRVRQAVDEVPAFGGRAVVVDRVVAIEELPEVYVVVR